VTLFSAGDSFNNNIKIKLSDCIIVASDENGELYIQFLHMSCFIFNKYLLAMINNDNILIISFDYPF